MRERPRHESFPVNGAFTFEVRGELAASDPDTLDSDSLLGRMVTLQVAQLVGS